MHFKIIKNKNEWPQLHNRKLEQKKKFKQDKGKK